MKRGLILTILTLAFLLVLTGLTLAKNGPHLGPGYPQETDACAGCHRSHTGTFVNLLFTDASNTYQFCTTCHNGTGANTNAVAGRFEGTVPTYGTQDDGTPGAGLNAGGFEGAFKYTARSNRTSDWAAITDNGKRHNATGDDLTEYIAYGGGTEDGGPGTSMPLKCTNCHDPHGTANPGPDKLVGTADDPSPGDPNYERYRVIKNKVNQVDVGDILSNEPAYPGNKDYTKDQYKVGLAEFCSACHTQYLVKESDYDAGDTQGKIKRFRHNVTGIKLPDGSFKTVTLGDGNSLTGNGRPMAENLNNNTPLPVEQDSYLITHSNSDRVTCLTCHQAHGTVATMTAGSVVAPANSSTLLRLNNRGVCQDCHQR